MMIKDIAVGSKVEVKRLVPVAAGFNDHSPVVVTEVWVVAKFTGYTDNGRHPVVEWSDGSREVVMAEHIK